ncbi:MAG: nucleotidyltransferase domain-containing protein [Magnetococcales bacterium]|nr:nucleotidyltransferase domain-containing protein [Magnetococcales bacterium]
MVDAPTLDLRPDHLTEVMRLLRVHLPRAEVWAFGSRVGGTSWEGSDLDLVVRHPDQLDVQQPSQFFDLKEALTDSNLPFLVEIHDRARIPESFHENIEKCHLVLQTGEAAPEFVSDEGMEQTPLPCAESALSLDWEQPGERKAWAHLQPDK